MHARRTVSRLAPLGALALTTLALAGCGGEGGQTTHSLHGSVTSSATPSEPASTVSVSPSPGSASPGAPSPAATEPKTARPPHAPVKRAPGRPALADLSVDVGGQVDVYGTPATVCIYGDGFGLHTVAAGPNTSCEFAQAVMDKATYGLNATYDNVRDTLPAMVVAHSPVTGNDYEMTCTTDNNLVITCRGGNAAEVYMY